MLALAGSPSLSLVRGDALFRLQRALGLIPAEGLGIARRAVLYALVAWLPIALWALWRGRAIDGGLDEPLLEHFGVHVRCLVAIPLLIVAEAVANGIMQRLLPQFVRAGIVSDVASFQAVVQGVARLRDRTLPWIVIAAVVAAWILLAPHSQQPHELLWAIQEQAPPGFGGWWYLYVARPIYVTLVLAWLWRVVLLFILMRRISKLELSLVPTHPDRYGGLGFLESLPSAFSPVVFALSAVLASGWAHDVVYHGTGLAVLRLQAIGFLALVALFFSAPLAVFASTLGRAKRDAILDYAALVGEHGRAVHARWIERRPLPENDLLRAPEIGPVADTLAIYHAVARMQTVPIGKKSLLAILAPALVPMIAVVALQIPAKELLLSVLKALT